MPSKWRIRKSPSLFISGRRCHLNARRQPSRKCATPRGVLASSLLRPLVGYVVLTADEVEGLCSNLLVSSGPATGSTRFSEWLGPNARELGVTWASELDRHFR